VGHGAKQLVADDMAEQVVGLLEMIEVDAEQGEAVAVGLRLVDGLGEMIDERGAVRQSGEIIVMGEMGDVFMSREQPSRAARSFSRASPRPTAASLTSSWRTLKLCPISPSSSREFT
jgi:hypothetical protein